MFEPPRSNAFLTKVGSLSSESMEIVQRHRPVYKIPEKEENSQGYKLDDSFQHAIRPVATFVQVLALMPVCGISSDDPGNLSLLSQIVEPTK